MAETNNRSAYSLDDREQAEPLKLSIRSCSRSSLEKLSCIEGRLSCIEKIKSQNVILYQAWMIKVQWADHMSQQIFFLKPFFLFYYFKNIIIFYIIF